MARFGHKVCANFFSGCQCKAGQCTTKACPCFASGRECDPDLCGECRTCTVPAGEQTMAPDSNMGRSAETGATSRQNCRNDSLSMRRHQHLMLGPSGVPEAGWGIYVKDKVPKGGFINE